MMTTQKQENADPKYSVVVRWSEIDNAYLAEVSEMPGVRGYGESREAAVKQAEDALELALEVHAARHWGAPQPDTSLGASGQFRLRLPRQMHARLSSAAAENGVSLNQFVVSLIADALARSEQVPVNAIAELQAWFELTLEMRVREAVQEALQNVPAYAALHVTIPREPFPAKKWQPPASKHLAELKEKLGQKGLVAMKIDPHQIMKK